MKYLFLSCLFVLGIDSYSQWTLQSLYHNGPAIAGKTECLDSPFVTAGNCDYMLGHQNGTNPIKLMDGFKASVLLKEETFELNNASQFIHYPTAKQSILDNLAKGLQVERWYFVSPDYGMIVQVWNIYSFAVPVVRRFFGIDPMVGRKTICIKPQMPSQWDLASLENVEIADNKIDVYYSRRKCQLDLTILHENDWNIIVELPRKNISELSPGNVSKFRKTTLLLR